MLSSESCLIAWQTLGRGTKSDSRFVRDVLLWCLRRLASNLLINAERNDQVEAVNRFFKVQHLWVFS